MKRAIATSIAGVVVFLALVGFSRIALYSSSAGAASPDFERSVIHVGKAPASVAVADVNHDGKLDLIVANTGEETVSVLLGDGKGHFSPAPGSPFHCGPGPNDIAIADMNHDGNPDLIIANTETPLITVLLGDGKGGFMPSGYSPFSTQSYPHVHGVAVADFTGDGKLDVVTDSWGNNQVLLLPGDGAGNLVLPGRLFNTGKRPYERVRSADFNKDGKPDIVTTDLDMNTVSILLGDGKGELRDSSGSPFPAGAAPWAVAIDDMNHDGNADLVILPYEPDVTDQKQFGVTVLLGDGRGGFTKMNGSPFSLDGCRGPNRVATGDINGDGLRDIAVSCAQNNKLMLFFGTREHGFRTAMQDVQTGWSGHAVADLNGDGKDDVIVSNQQLENSGKPSPDTITIFFSK